MHYLLVFILSVSVNVPYMRIGVCAGEKDLVRHDTLDKIHALSMSCSGYESEQLVFIWLLEGVMPYLRFPMSTGDQYILARIAKEAEPKFCGWDVHLSRDIVTVGVAVDLVRYCMKRL